MKFLLDTANLEEIKKYEAIIPLSGVTSNPTIVKKEGKIAFFAHMKEIRAIIGMERSLHVQVVAEDFSGMMRDAYTILEKIDPHIFIKVPVTTEGMKAIKALKKEGIHVTATAIYTKFQAYLALGAEADYLAPYFNRMENANIDPRNAIREMAHEIQRTNSQTKILAASFKNIEQVNTALECGAQAATMSGTIIKQALTMPAIEKAVGDFTEDWVQIFGIGKNISNL